MSRIIPIPAVPIVLLAGVLIFALFAGYLVSTRRRIIYRSEQPFYYWAGIGVGAGFLAWMLIFWRQFSG